MSTVPGAHDPGRPLSHLSNVADALDSPSPHGSSVVTRSPLNVLAAASVRVDPKFWPERSDRHKNLFAFVYKVRIQNVGEVPFAVRKRRWEIIDAFAEHKVVQGEGVVGQQPTLTPGEAFEYASFCPIDTRWGTMEGFYTLELPDGSCFEAQIGRFFLVGPEP